MVRISVRPDVHGRVGDVVVKRRALTFSFLIVLIPVATLNAQSSTQPFLGRWDLTLKTPTKELPSWIEVSGKEGQPKIIMVGISEHATPLPKVQLKEGEIEFLSPKGAEGFSEDMVFKGRLVGGQLKGIVTSSSGTSWPWIGQRAPALKRAGAPAWGKPCHFIQRQGFRRLEVQ